MKNIESATECQQKCQENPDCLFFTWNSGTGGGSWNTKMKNTCWLKKEKDEVEKDCGIRCTGRVSGPKDCGKKIMISFFIQNMFFFDKKKMILSCLSNHYLLFYFRK